ncbi:hypothetical protein FSP39_003623 [Pinctada imbricata]|uniref:SGNH hydrolase-type esterase domain-containing protein n=1 Tax=Pinctada imbricata TaxID=66713 RepID=A0AA88YVQ5_PINIB|nr:hypothetical protein FSP39_003623 [Pinctada imbricata]
MNPAAQAQPLEDVQGDGRWMSQHARFIAEAKEKEPEVLFIGDSLILHMAHSSMWTKMFEPLHSLNFGIGGDQTQHVLWRVQNGEMENLEPKVIVLLVGTNNYEHTAEQVTGGIEAIVQAIAERQPQAQIVVMGIPPRGENPNPLRDKILNINSNLSAKYKDSEKVTFLNVESETFVRDGVISHLDMYDYLHFTDQGYQKLCEPLCDEIQNLLQVYVKCENTSMTQSTTASDVDDQQ